MDIYSTEQEQVEAIKAWWDKNGRSALVVLALFLLSVLAGQAWLEQRHKQAEAAAADYQRVQILIEDGNAQAMEAGRALIAKHAGSIYAAMTSLSLAKLAVEQQDLDGAAAHLRAAMGQSDLPELAQVARLRLARVESAQGKVDAALVTLAAGGKDAASDELRGDLLLAQDKRAEARSAYLSALEGYSSVVDKRELVQLKLDELAE